MAMTTSISRIAHRAVLIFGAASVAAALTIASAAVANDGVGVVPTNIDRQSAERALSGAEWLAARIDPAGKPAPAGTAPIALIEWLIWQAGAEKPKIHDKFATALAGLGYGDPSWAVSLWFEDITGLVAAYRAGRATDARPLAEIDDDIRAQPTVPLDEAGEETLERLLDERMLTATPAESRAVATMLAPRIEAVLAKVAEGEP